MAKAKKIRDLDCGAPMVEGVRLVFVTRFNELLEWRKEALNWSDPEGVHSMRVASRRLRSVMRDFLPYLPKKSFAPVLKQLKGLADALGEVRDQDVAIEALEQIEKKVPAEHAAGFQQFVAKRKEVREHRRRELKALLAKAELKTLQTDFAAAVEEATSVAERKRKRSDPTPFMKVSREIIRDRLKEFEKRSNGLFKPLDVVALHDLRIATKRLRYAIELLGPCFDRSISAHAKRAARLQGALGDLHDCDSWILNLGDEIVPARKEKATEQVAALTWLLNYFAKLRTKHLQHAFGRWREWEAHDSSNKLRHAVSDQQPLLVETATPPEPQPEISTETESPAETDAAAVPVPEDQIAGEQMRQAL
jgi:CHAD domain-containing protein